MPPALTTTTWLRVFDHYRKLTPTTAQRDSDLLVVKTMAQMLYDIATTTDDQRVADVLDAYGLTMLGELP